MEFVESFAALAGAVTVYSIGGVAGLAYRCSKKSKTWSEIPRHMAKELKGESKPSAFLIRRAN